MCTGGGGILKPAQDKAEKPRLWADPAPLTGARPPPRTSELMAQLACRPSLASPTASVPRGGKPVWAGQNFKGLKINAFWSVFFFFYTGRGRSERPREDAQVQELIIQERGPRTRVGLRMWGRQGARCHRRSHAHSARMPGPATRVPSLEGTGPPLT